jgi:hypothetical protein
MKVETSCTMLNKDDKIKDEKNWTRKLCFNSTLDVLALINHFVKWVMLKKKRRRRRQTESFKCKKKKNSLEGEKVEEKAFSNDSTENFCRLRLWTFFLRSYSGVLCAIPSCLCLSGVLILSLKFVEDEKFLRKLRV